MTSNSDPAEPAASVPIDLDEAPLFDIDETHEPEESISDDGIDDKGGMVLEGVNIPFDALEFGNGQLPDSMLQRIGIAGHRLHPAAAAAFLEFKALAAQAGIDLTCTDSYRTIEQQRELKQRKPTLSATPGKSVHGWGFAVDVSIGSPPKGFGQSVLDWLKQNGPPHGWFLGRPKDEPWHWVYRGAGNPASGPADTSRIEAAGRAAADPGITGNTEIALGASGVGVAVARGLLGLAPGDTFDEECDAAARAFQQANGLGVDGKIGPRTWAALRSRTAPTERPELTLGASGDAVSWLQRRLALGVSGSFDAATESAVKAFQQARSLFVDGRVGPKTWASLAS